MCTSFGLFSIPWGRSCYCHCFSIVHAVVDLSTDFRRTFWGGVQITHSTLRTVKNICGRVDHRPLSVVFCSTTQPVVACVSICLSRGLPPSTALDSCRHADTYLGDDDVPSLHAALELLLAAHPPRAEDAVNTVLHVARVRENEARLHPPDEMFFRVMTRQRKRDGAIS